MDCHKRNSLFFHHLKHKNIQSEGWDTISFKGLFKCRRRPYFSHKSWIKSLIHIAKKFENSFNQRIGLKVFCFLNEIFIINHQIWAFLFLATNWETGKRFKHMLLILFWFLMFEYGFWWMKFYCLNHNLWWMGFESTDSKHSQSLSNNVSEQKYEYSVTIFVV